MNNELKNRANPNCSYCLGQGSRNNGYFNYPCNCAVGNPIFNFASCDEDFLLDEVVFNPTPKNIFKLPIIHHKTFGNLDDDKANIYLDFLAETLRKLNSFTVWDVENCHSEEDDAKWNEEAAVVFLELLSLRDELDEILSKLDEQE